MKNINKGYLLTSILVTVIIWFNSFLPADISGAQSGFIVSNVMSVLNVFGIQVDLSLLSLIIRKLAHFVQFFILGFLWFKTFHAPKRMISISVLLAIVICYMTAIIDESIQIFSYGRVFSVIDILIDQLGATLSILITAHFAQRKKRKSIR
ncbi:MAG: VanZ family protein [Acholeplasmataceae bacterium]|nr:VanZ family protein [Acholeplasmataceae bacterium]